MDNKEYGVKLNVDLSQFKTKMQEAQEITKDFSNKVRENVDVKPEIDTSKLKETEQNAKSFSSRIKDSLKNMWDGMGTTGRLITILGLVTVFSKISGAISKARQANEKFKASLTKLSNDLKTKLAKNLNSNIAGLKRFGFQLLGVQGLWKGLSKAVNSYMSYDSELSKQIQNTWAGLGSFFAPILEYLVSAFQKLLGYINAVVTALTGINFVARANQKAMKGMAGATASANKQLSKLDEIENLNLDSGAGGGAGGNPIEIPEVDASKLEDFIKKVKDMLSKGQFYELGYELAQTITNALKKIPWGKIKKTARKVGKSLAEFLNGGIEGTDWKVVGNTIAQSINTALEFAYSFISTFEWRKFGESIGTFLQTTISNINWTKLGKTFTEAVAGIFSVGIGFLQNLNGVDLAKKLEEYIKNIDVGKIASSFYEIMGSLYGFIISFAGTLVGDFVASIQNYFTNKINEYKSKFGDNGFAIIIGILDGIVSALVNLGTWIGDNVLTPFLDGFKKAFKIDGGNKSGKTKSVGEAIINGIVWGLQNLNPQRQLQNAIKGIVNIVIDLLNKGIDKINSKLSISLGGGVGDLLKKAGIDVPKSFSFNISKIPKLSVGTDEVYKEGLAYLHAGEQVVPAEVAKNGYNTSNQTTDYLLEVLIDKMDDLSRRPNIFNVNGKELARATYSDFQNEGNRLGSSNLAVRRR